MCDFFSLGIYQSKRLERKATDIRITENCNYKPDWTRGRRNAEKMLWTFLRTTPKLYVCRLSLKLCVENNSRSTYGQYNC